MCDPVTLISAGAQVAGAAMQNSASQRAEDRKASLNAKNREANRLLEQEARLAIDNSLNSMSRDNFDAGRGAASDELRAAYDAATSGGVDTRVKAGTPDIVQAAVNKAVDDANAFALAQNKALGELNSLSEYLVTTVNPNLNKSAVTGQLMGNFMQGNSGVLASELDAANRLAYSPLAQLLTLGGQAGVSYGLKAPTTIGENAPTSRLAPTTSPRPVARPTGVSY